MRATVFALLIIPALASAQVDLTPSSEAPLDVDGLRVLQHAAGPGSDASPAVAWCVADSYRILADRADDPRVAGAARNQADQWDRLAAARLARLPSGVLVLPGQEVVVPVRDGVVCRTKARVSYPIRG